MNEQGDIVGESQTANGVFHATLWPVEGATVDLDTLGSRFSLAYTVNSARGRVPLTYGKFR
jgi:probable HAF family extracellular repeat protein